MITDITAVSDKAGFQALYPVWNEDNENSEWESDSSDNSSEFELKLDKFRKKKK